MSPEQILAWESLSMSYGEEWEEAIQALVMYLEARSEPTYLLPPTHTLFYYGCQWMSSVPHWFKSFLIPGSFKSWTVDGCSWFLCLWGPLCSCLPYSKTRWHHTLLFHASSWQDWSPEARGWRVFGLPSPYQLTYSPDMMSLIPFIILKYGQAIN